MTNLAADLGVTVGSIFQCSWGYDQTNVDYYVVERVSASGKSVTIRKCGAHRTAEDRVFPQTAKHTGECGNCGQYIRDARELDGQPQGTLVHLTGYVACAAGKGTATPHLWTKRIQTYEFSGERRVALSIASYANAYLWDGADAYVTPAGLGH